MWQIHLAARSPQVRQAASAGRKTEAKIMQHALNIQTLVDQAVINAIPAFKALVGAPSTDDRP